MRNIGKVSRRWLHEVGIDTLEELKTCGAVRTYRMVKSQQSRATLNLLWGLVAAIEDIDWRDLSPERKAELQEELKA